MDALTQAGQQLDQLLADVRAAIDARKAELQQQELALAAGAEAATMAAMDSEAFRRGAEANARKVQALIDQQLDALPHSSHARTVLHTLSRMVGEGEA